MFYILSRSNVLPESTNLVDISINLLVVSMNRNNLKSEVSNFSSKESYQVGDIHLIHSGTKKIKNSDHVRWFEYYKNELGTGQKFK